jgi:hypothetical protein
MGIKYALLISGDIAETGYDEFWNDVVLMYEALIQNGFQSNNIFVLYGNGTDYFDVNRPNPRYRPTTAITNLSASQTNVTNTLNGLANGTNGMPQLTKEDLFFIWTFDHGNSNGANSYLCLTDGDMLDTTFTNLVTQIPCAYRIVCMQQCFGGAFVPLLSNDSNIILTACLANELGHRCDTENEVVNNVTYHHGEFNYYLFSSLTGNTVTGTAVSADADSNGFVTMREVFNYIQNNDSRPETPQYDDGSLHIGNKFNLSFADIYIRDNLQDTGAEPLVSGGISCSPDINHFRDQLADPQTTLCSNAARNQGNLFDNVEFGQTNYIYVRLQNRGYSTSDADIDLYWSMVSTLPTPGSWNFIGNISTPTVNPGEFKAVGPLEWSNVPAEGHYCFVALLGNTQDPKPDINSIMNINDFYNLVRLNNNVTWKNFDVYDLLANSYCNFDFLIQGWPRISYMADLELNFEHLPETINLNLTLLNRLTQKAIPSGMILFEKTKLYSNYKINSNKKVILKNLSLLKSDKSIATIGIYIPDKVPEGIFQISAVQKIFEKEMGRVTGVFRIRKFPFVGDILKKEIHKANCEMVSKISPKNKVAFGNVDLALAKGYNNCNICLPKKNFG